MKLAVSLAVAIACVAMPDRADAYEFWLRAQSIGQGYQLRDYRLSGPDLFLGRRRYVETLALRIWDIGGFAEARRRSHLPDRGMRITWQSYLRIDHDFGTYSTGRVQLVDPPLTRDALDAIPELGASIANLSLLYGYAQIDGLFDDRLTIQLGRTLADDGWAPTAVDGGSVRVELPQPIAITASAGLRVREATPLGISAYELDGTSGAGCREFVEGTAPGTGSWQLIDRSRAVHNVKLTSDYEYCPQRLVRQPSIGVTIATAHLRTLGIEVGYRRTSSATVGVIGDPDRLATTDVGLYPAGAPESGVNEERLWARAHVDLTTGGLAIKPYTAIRASLLHGLVDRGDLGVQLVHGAHTLEPSVAYFYPTFDGDSIFNAFSIEATADARLGYRYSARGWSATADAWLRKYLAETEDAYAGGGDASIEHAIDTHWRGRATALADAGYGGTRTGGSLEVGWKPRRDRRGFLRASSIWLHEDDHLSVLARNTVTSAATLGMSFQFADGVAVHLTGETAYDDVHELQFRGIAVLDLAFAPEP